MENLLTNELETELISYPQVFDVVNFMCAGVVGYSDVDDGTYLLRKETLEKMLPSIVGRPVIIDHQKITKENIENLAVGYVTGARYNHESGQFDCTILITDKETAEKIKSGDNKVSSAYTVTEFGGGGRYSGIEYDAEILDGTFTHLAIVDNPRYPDGKILINNLTTKNKGVTMFFKLNKQNEDETKEQKVNEEDLIEIDGDKVELKDLIDAYKNACKKNEEDEKKENKRNEEDEDEKENKCNEEDEKKDEDKENEDSDDDLVSKVTKIVEKILAEKTQEDEEKKENKKNEDDEKANKISSYEKSNSLRQASKLYVADTLNYKTRAEKIAESNKKYSL